MSDAVNERFERIEANLEKASAQIQDLTTFVVQSAERQSVFEHQQEQINAKIDRILAAIAVDAENIRALARIAEAHQRRIEDLEGGEAQ